jgi:DNA-binding NarL/FixJ family response regulator
MSTVWIVDDHRAFRKTLAHLLEGGGVPLATRAFASCEEALAALVPGAEPALVLLDIGLRGMSGLAGIPLFKARSPSIAIVVLTVFEDDDKLFRAICAGANGYLLKTQSAEELLRCVQSAIEGGAPMSPKIARRVLEMFASLAPKKQADYALSAREAEVLQCVVDGLLNKQIAERLNLSVHTVDSYLRRIYEKLHVNSRSGAVSKAIRENILQIE